MANRYLTYLFGRRHRAARGEEQNDREVFFPREVFDEFQRLVKTLVREDRVFVSDRKLVGILVTAQIARAESERKTGETIKEISGAASRKASHARG